jgi:hypothetical protein
VSTIYTERTIVSRAHGEGRLTIADVCDLEKEMRALMLEPAVLRAHPADLSAFKAEVYERTTWIRLELTPEGLQRWCDLLLVLDVRVGVGEWVVETKAAVDREALT